MSETDDHAFFELAKLEGEDPEVDFAIEVRLTILGHGKRKHRRDIAKSVVRAVHYRGVQIAEAYYFDDDPSVVPELMMIAEVLDEHHE